LLFFTFFSLTPYAFSTNYYVNQSTGSDNYNGLYETYQGGSDGPWKTMGMAARTVPGGANHIINVAAGTYNGMTDSRSGVSPGHRHWFATGTVTITSEVTLDGSWVKFDGFTITGPRVGLATGSGSSNITITNCIVYACTYGMFIDGTKNQILSNDLSKNNDYFHVFGSGHTFRENYIHNHINQTNFHSDVWQTYRTTASQNILIERNHVFMGNDVTGALSVKELAVSIFSCGR
jgi:parallel beta-helix repeat protein